MRCGKAPAGAGQYRGGMGVVRDYRVLADDIVVSLSSERQHVAAAGANGGATGALGAFVLNPDTAEERKLPSAAADVKLPQGFGAAHLHAVRRRDTAMRPSAMRSHVDARPCRKSASSARAGA